MKKKNKIVLIVIVILIFIYGIIFFTDMNRVKQLKKPIFCIENGYMGSMTRFDGLGYKIGLDINATTGEITYGQMTMLGKMIVKLYIDDDEMKTTYVPSELENVSISISNISLTGATIIIKDTNKKTYTYGAWYKIEKQVDEEWKEVKTIRDDYAFNSIAYLPDENNEVKFEMDWEWLYGELPIGSYRILKQVNGEIISIEFGIAETSK